MNTNTNIFWVNCEQFLHSQFPHENMFIFALLIGYTNDDIALTVVHSSCFDAHA